MNLQKIPLYITMLFFVGLFSCHKPTPQLPSNKGIEQDENSTSLLKINTELAIREDSILENYVKLEQGDYKKNELGFWYKITKKADGDYLKENETCHIEIKLHLLNGQVVQQSEMDVTIGKKQIVSGLEEGLKILHKGENATFIIPWYLGYGRKGFESTIPPYTSLVYEVKLNN